MFLLSLGSYPVPICPLPSLNSRPPRPTKPTLLLSLCVPCHGGRYPVILNSFGLRRGSGGGGARRGGDGVSRDMTFRKKLTVSVLSERRAFRPWGLAGGLPAERGVSCSAFELLFFFVEV